MRTVWKLPAHPRSYWQSTQMLGRDPVPLALAEDGQGVLCMWVEVDPYEYKEAGPLSETTLNYAVIGTGWDIPPGAKYVDTCVTRAGYVWHLYKETTG